MTIDMSIPIICIKCDVQFMRYDRRRGRICRECVLARARLYKKNIKRTGRKKKKYTEEYIRKRNQYEFVDHITIDISIDLR